MHKYEGKSVRDVETATGKIPSGVGFPSGKQSGGGVIRKLTKREIEGQRALSQPSR